MSQASTAELTDKEQLLAEAKQFDLEKFLLVKQLLLDGNSYSKINQLTGIAKTTISKYKKHYCKKTINLIKRNYQKTFPKPSETTKKP